MGWDIELLVLLSKRRKVIGTKCSWTFCNWDKMWLGLLAFGTKCIWDFWSLGQISFFWDTYALGQKALGQNVSGTNYLRGKGQWDNSPKSVLSLGQKVEWTFL